MDQKLAGLCTRTRTPLLGDSEETHAAERSSWISDWMQLNEKSGYSCVCETCTMLQVVITADFWAHRAVVPFDAVDIQLQELSLRNNFPA